jgi:hypothetical protein
MYEDFTITGAGVYTGSKMFGHIVTIDTHNLSTLGGEETITVGVGNTIGIPTNIQYNSAFKLVYLGGVIPADAVYHAGVNVSGLDVSGAIYNGVKPLIVTYKLDG